MEPPSVCLLVTTLLPLECQFANQDSRSALATGRYMKHNVSVQSRNVIANRLVAPLFEIQSGDDRVFSIRVTAARSDGRCTLPFVHRVTRVRPILPATRPTSIITLSFGRPWSSAVTMMNTAAAHTRSVRSKASKVSKPRGNSSVQHSPMMPFISDKRWVISNASSRSADEDPTDIVFFNRLGLNGPRLLKSYFGVRWFHCPPLVTVTIPVLLRSISRVLQA
jgi:hypothetical protein